MLAPVSALHTPKKGKQNRLTKKVKMKELRRICKELNKSGLRASRSRPRKVEWMFKSDDSYGNHSNCTDAKKSRDQHSSVKGRGRA